jgi:hypothetical protein
MNPDFMKTTLSSRKEEVITLLEEKSLIQKKGKTAVSVGHPQISTRVYKLQENSFTINRTTCFGHS